MPCMRPKNKYAVVASVFSLKKEKECNVHWKFLNVHAMYICFLETLGQKSLRWSGSWSHVSWFVSVLRFVRLGWGFGGWKSWAPSCTIAGRNGVLSWCVHCCWCYFMFFPWISHLHQCKYDWIFQLNFTGFEFVYVHFLLETLHSLPDWPGYSSHSGQALNLTMMYFLSVMAAAILSGASPSTCHPSVKGSGLRFTVCVFLHPKWFAFGFERPSPSHLHL